MTEKKHTAPALKVAGFAAGLLVLLTLMVRAGTPLDGIDTAIVGWLAYPAEGTAWRIVLRVTDLGDGTTVVPIMLVISLFLYRAGDGRLILPQWGGYLGARIVTDGLKLTMGRARPELLEWERLIAEATTHSFPSGHATSAVYVYGFLLLFVLRAALPRPLTYVAVGLLAVIIAAIAVSRILLGVHYPSDVLGGVLSGGMMLALVSPYVTPRKA